MITFKTAPRGTATVTEAHAESMRDQFAALKPLKPTKIKAHARRFPHPNGFWSTEDYIRQYFALNSYMKIAAYGAHTDHVSLYHPLPDRVARLDLTDEGS